VPAPASPLHPSYGTRRPLGYQRAPVPPGRKFAPGPDPLNHNCAQGGHLQPRRAGVPEKFAGSRGRSGAVTNPQPAQAISARRCPTLTVVEPMRTLLLLTCIALAGCASPLNSRGVSTDLAGRCKLMAHSEDRGGMPPFGYLGTSGLIALSVAQSREDARRQEIYDACVAAGGTREQPAEMPN
jgi:hypothetical protein